MKRRKSRERALRLRVALLSFVAAFGVLLLVVCLVLPRYRYKPLSDTPEDLGFENTFDKNVVNIALFGLDAREPDSFSGLSDSIMIISLNTETKKIKLLSVMRDSLVPIDHKGTVSYGKINGAYLRGGPSLAIKTINQSFGLDIEEYVTVNFFGLSSIIDAMGGLDITLTEQEVTSRGKTHQSGINDYILEICQKMGKDPSEYYIDTPGEIHANGIQAVAYSRIRYVPNVWGGRDDFGRTDRQRYVLEQLFNHAKGMKKSKYIQLAKAMIPYTETSLSYTEIMGLAMSVLLDNPSFEQMRIPRYEFVMDSPAGAYSSTVYYDLDYAAAVIHAVIYEDMTIDAFEDIRPVEKKDWFANRAQ